MASIVTRSQSNRRTLGMLWTGRFALWMCANNSFSIVCYTLLNLFFQKLRHAIQQKGIQPTTLNLNQSLTKNSICFKLYNNSLIVFTFFSKHHFLITAFLQWLMGLPMLLMWQVIPCTSLCAMLLLESFCKCSSCLLSLLFAAWVGLKHVKHSDVSELPEKKIKAQTKSSSFLEQVEC